MGKFFGFLTRSVLSLLIFVLLIPVGIIGYLAIWMDSDARAAWVAVRLLFSEVAESLWKFVCD